MRSQRSFNNNVELSYKISLASPAASLRKKRQESMESVVWTDSDPNSDSVCSPALVTSLGDRANEPTVTATRLAKTFVRCYVASLSKQSICNNAPVYSLQSGSR